MSIKFKTEPAQTVLQHTLTQTGDKGRYRSPDGIDHRPHVSSGSLAVGLPIRYHFVHIKNRLIVTETDLIKQRNVAAKLFPNEDLVVSPHRNDEVGSPNEISGELSLDVCGGISSLLTQPGLNPVMHRLWLDVDPGRADYAGCADLEPHLERILGCHAPENVPRTYKEN